MQAFDRELEQPCLQNMLRTDNQEVSKAIGICGCLTSFFRMSDEEYEKATEMWVFIGRQSDFNWAYSHMVKSYEEPATFVSVNANFHNTHTRFDCIIRLKMCWKNRKKLPRIPDVLFFFYDSRCRRFFRHWIESKLHHRQHLDSFPIFCGAPTAWMYIVEILLYFWDWNIHCGRFHGCCLILLDASGCVSLSCCQIGPRLRVTRPRDQGQCHLVFIWQSRHIATSSRNRCNPLHNAIAQRSDCPGRHGLKCNKVRVAYARILLHDEHHYVQKFPCGHWKSYWQLSHWKVIL